MNSREQTCRLWRFLAILLVVAGSLNAAPSRSAGVEKASDEAAIRSGREALRKSENYPWYDSKTDSVRRIDVQPPAASQANSNWRFNPSFNFFTTLAWIGIALLLGLLVYLLIKAFLDRERRLIKERLVEQQTPGTEIDRVEHLPIQIRKPRGDLLSEVREHYRNGNYRDAIIYFYGHLLVELDKQQLIRLSRGKTNRQYLRELISREALQGIVEQTMLVFEDVFFGHQELSRERFETCWNRLPDFDAMLQWRTA